MDDLLELKKELKELKFRFKALVNFVYEHHHTVDVDTAPIDAEPYYKEHETSKAKVWVETKDGFRREPTD